MSLLNQDQWSALGLLGSGMMAGNAPGGFQAAIGLLDAAPEKALKMKYMQAQMEDVLAQAALRKAQVEKEQEGAKWMQGLQARGPTYAPGQFGSGTMGILPSAGDPMSPVPVRPGGLAGLTPDEVAMAENRFGYKLMEPWKIAKEGIELRPGTFRENAYTGKRDYIPDVKTGLGVDAAGNVIELPNFAAVNARIKGAETDAQEQAKARNTPLGLDFVDTNTGRPIGGSVGDYLNKRPMPNMGGGEITPELAQFIREDAARNGISNPQANFKGAGQGAGYGLSRAPFSAPTALQSKAEGEGAIAAAKLPVQTADKVNETWLKTSYEPTVTAGNAATEMLTNVQVARQSMRNMGGTGWGAEAKAVGANVLAGLGVAPDSAKMFASNAQTFQNAAMSNLQTVLNAAKGPQTEGDAQRASQTFAQLKNTPQANEFILDLAEARAQRDAMKARFFQEALPIAKSKGDLQEVEREWMKRAPSVFSLPSMQRWAKGIK